MEEKFMQKKNSFLKGLGGKLIFISLSISVIPLVTAILIGIYFSTNEIEKLVYEEGKIFSTLTRSPTFFPMLNTWLSRIFW